MLDEWAGSLIRELDYRQEARNGARFRDLFGHFPDLYVPHMYGGLTTRRGERRSGGGGRAGVSCDRERGSVLRAVMWGAGTRF